MRTIRKIIIHCSASENPEQDNIEAIKRLHTSSKEAKIKWGEYNTTGKEFSDIGYHGFVDSKGEYFLGRSVNMHGAHCYGYNYDSIGYCLSGVTPKAASIDKLLLIVQGDLTIYGLTAKDVIGHSELNKYKTCPNIDMDNFRRRLDGCN